MAEIPYEYVTTTGLIVPDTGDILTNTQNEYKSIFGADLIVSPSTPQGVLITAETIARTEVVNNNAAVANQFNPNISGSVFLWSIGALTGLEPPVGTPTFVSGVTIAGVPFTVIAAGVQAQTPAGDIFESLATVTIPAGGTITVDFQSLETGPIPCAINALRQIVTPILGWETVRNSEAGLPGVAALSDAAYRILRNNTLALQGSGLIFAIKSRVSAISGVQSMSIIENFNSLPKGMLISITGGSTLAGEIWGLTTLSGSGSGGSIVIDTDPINFAESLQSLPPINPWPIAAFSTVDDISLAGLSTQPGGDWVSGLSGGEIILVKNQTDPIENGLWIADSGPWTRQAYNAAGSTILGSNQGISLIKNSIYTCVNGGDSIEIATALLSSKSLGCAWNGEQEEDIVDPSSGQTYPVLFDRPTDVLVSIKVYASAPTTIGDPTDDIKQSILDYVNGLLPGQPGFVVGGNVSSFELAGAVNIQFPTIYVSKVQTDIGDGFTSDEIIIGKNQIPTTTSGSITVVLS